MFRPRLFRSSYVLTTLAAVLALAALPSVARADLNADLRRVLADKYLAKANVGVVVARLGDKSDDTEVIFRHNGTTPLIPASNLKIVTTAAALKQLGPDFKFRTMLLMNRDGDLCLVGDGDPTLGDVELLKKVGWDVTTVFKLWAEELKRRGVAAVSNVLVDDSVFDETFLHPNWPADQEQRRYVAQVGGLNLNANCVDFYVRTTGFNETVTYTVDPPTQYLAVQNSCVTGNRSAVWLARERGKNTIILRGEANASNDVPFSITIHDPGLFAGTVLAETLEANGVRIGGSVVRDRTIRAAFEKDPVGGNAAGWTVVAALETPLASVLARANKDSMNLYAEALCKRLGFAATGEPATWASGTAVVGTFLREQCEVPEEQFTLDDGCGLSKENAISAEALVRVLAREHTGKHADVFRTSLAQSGVDGTLENRFNRTDLRGRVYGKSGYVNYVSSLTGYVQARDGRWYAFAILMNNVPFRTNNTAKEIQEKIVSAIDENASPATAAAR